MITRMNHTGFIVADLDKSVDFYTNVMGLKIVRRIERDGGPISQVLAYPDTHIKAALLGLEGEEGHILELISNTSTLRAPNAQPRSVRCWEPRTSLSTSPTCRQPSPNCWRPGPKNSTRLSRFRPAGSSATFRTRMATGSSC